MQKKSRLGSGCLGIFCGKKVFWFLSEADLSSPFFAETMNRHQFRDIKRYLHLCDHVQLGNQKMAEVIPIYVLNNTMQIFGVLLSLTKY